MINPLKTCVALMFALLTFGATAQTMNSVDDISKEVNKAKALFDNLSTSPTTDWDIFVAISKSIPKSSLERLAQDAATAKIPLVLQGVGIEPPAQEQKGTMLETYGKHWVARHLEDWTFVTQKGATLQIDPVRFTKARIFDVPQVILMKRCNQGASCDTTPLVFRARGDVTLDYAINELRKTLSEQPNTLSEKDQASALKLLEVLCHRLEGKAS